MNMDEARAPSVSNETTITMSSIENRSCPLCKSDLRLFFINFNDKMLMCENTECEFPFGYEELQFFKENNEQLCDVELDSQSIKRMSTPAASEITKLTSFSDIEKINRACLSEDCRPLENHVLRVHEFINQPPIKKPNKSVIGESVQKNLTVIRECSEKLKRKKQQQEGSTLIKSEDMLLKLAELEKSSGSKMLQPIEMSILREKGIDLSEKKQESVKIDIKKEGDNIFQIDLELLDDGE